MANFINNRRNDGRIEGLIKGQKPACKITIYRWDDPAITGLEASNLNTQGNFFNNVGGIQSKVKNSIKQPLMIDNDIVKCTVHKNKNSSSGTFSLVLKRGNTEIGSGVGKPTVGEPIDYLKKINPGDWIAIYMKKDDNIQQLSNSADSGLKMLGIIENVRYVEIDDPELGKPRLEYVVTGRDFGKIFENEIYFNPIINNIKGIQQFLGISFLQSAKKSLGHFEGAQLSPDKLLKALIDFYIGGKDNSVASSNNVWFVPSGVNKLITNRGGNADFNSILDKDRIGLQLYKNHTLQGSPKPLLGFTTNYTVPHTGTIWQTLQYYSNPVLNEMVVDLTNKNGKLVPSIQIRQLPYSNNNYSQTNIFKISPLPTLDKKSSSDERTLYLNLPKHSIKSTDIKQKNVGKSDFERINAIVITPNVPTGSQGESIHQAYLMAMNVPSIQRYGLKLLQGNTFYTASSNSGLALTEYAAKIVSLMSDWFMQAHLYYNGVIITDGTDEFVEIGTNLHISDINQLFHIEGISYVYEINNSTGNTIYNTEFRVSRGVRVNKNITASDFIGTPRLKSEDKDITIITNAIENVRND